MSVFIGKIVSESISIQNAVLHTVTARVKINFYTGNKVQVYQMVPDPDPLLPDVKTLLGESSALVKQLTVQEVSLDVLALNTNPLLVQLDVGFALANDISATEKNLPGMEIINFRWLPESVKASVVAGDFDVPANVVIDVNGIGVSGTTPAIIPFVHDNVVLFAKGRSLNVEGNGLYFNRSEQDLGDAPSICVGDQLINVYSPGPTWMIDDGSIDGEYMVTMTSVPLGALTAIQLGIGGAMNNFNPRFTKFLLLGWDNPV